MKHPVALRACFSPFLLSLLFFICLGGSPAHAYGDSAILLGKGKTEITPPAGTPLAGFGKRRGKPSTGVHDPIYARALSLSRGDQKFIFMSLDLVLIDEKLRAGILKKIRLEMPLKNEELILFATHTHSGAGAIGGRFWEKFIMGKFNRKVYEALTSSAARAAVDSLSGQTAVTIEYGETRIEDLVENRLDPRLDRPRRLKVLRFKTGTGLIAGHLVFMAAHPTLGPKAGFEFSADFPGALNGELEKRYPDSISVFVNGAAADLRPNTADFPDSVTRISAYGFAVASRVDKLAFAAITSEGPWAGVSEKIKLPPTKLRRGVFHMPSLVGGRFFPRSSIFQAVRLGRLLFLTFPGEIDSDTGYEIEMLARSRLFQPFVIGYANDYIAYVVPRRFYFDQSQYESQVSFYGPKMDWFVQEQSMRLADRLLTKQELAIIRPEGKLAIKDGLAVLKLKGDPYHVGFEEGRLLRSEIHSETKQVFDYLFSQVHVPLLKNAVFAFMLGRGWNKMEDYVTYREYLQMKGIADGSGVSFKTIKRMHALPEVFPSWCTNGAYWGKATQEGRMIAIRNLDWVRKLRIHEHAAVKVIDVPGEMLYANIGYAGFAGVLSGMNESGISVGQIGASSADESIQGVPMPFLLKRILEESKSVTHAKAIFKRSVLTRGYNYVIADAVRKEAIVAEATHTKLAFFLDADPKEKDIPYACPIENAVFRGDPAIDPAIRDVQLASKGNPKKKGLEMPAGSAYEIRYKKQGELIQKNYGKITPQTAMEIAKEIAPGSNIQSVVYAFPDFWVANAKENHRAVDEKYVHLNMEELK